jgi:hypothetical protein
MIMKKHSVQALPLRDYTPFDPTKASSHMFVSCCKGQLQHSHPDDDINYAVLALICGRRYTGTDLYSREK